jgi:hypothetical protein
VAQSVMPEAGVDIYWQPHHEVHPELTPDQDLIGFDGGQDIGRVYLMTNSQQAGRWSWSMYAHSNTGRVPFLTSHHSAGVPRG